LKFHGSICAIVTPFADSGAVDDVAFRRLLEMHRAAGTQAVVVGGSTGESGALDEAEFETLVEIARSHTGDGLPVIAGCGAAATHKALRLAECARERGAHALLAVTPFYSRPTQEGLYRHYSALADNSGLPVILYNVPSRTGCDLLPETVARLAVHPRIVGIKEARPEAERMQALLPLKSATFAVLSGDDPTATRALLAGADGVISVVANVAPLTFRAFVDAARRGDTAAANALDASLAPIYQLLGVEPNPIPVKWLLRRLGLCSPVLRLPLLELSSAHHAEAETQAGRIRELERRDNGRPGATRAA
jgi:4-hydroxy-tetrahydrodipicolinate synthase